jgi:hypothetical protein
LRKNKKTIRLIAAGVVAVVSYVIAKKTQKEMEQERVKIFDSVNVNYGDEDN